MVSLCHIIIKMLLFYDDVIIFMPLHYGTIMLLLHSDIMMSLCYDIVNLFYDIITL